MKKIYKRIISIILVITTLLCSTLPTFAAEVEEEYLSDLRIIYADDLEEAREAIEGTEFDGYKVLNANLNADTGEEGVWLAYKTSTDIEDAITDISIMQMDGGYKEGNYQAMIAESRTEYEAMGENYLLAIDYFVNAYDEGHFLAELAYRQLNLYTVITDESLGIAIPDFDGEPLGDIFYDGITASELATIFMEGNSYALSNIRSLLAMGVSYNEDGMHYLEKVAELVERYENNANEIEEHEYYDDFDDLSTVISGSIKRYKEQFKELATREDEMNFRDDEVTELELQYLDIKSIADRFREVDYLNGETLYDFCLGYEYDEDDLSSLYPLAAALNEGQIAMVRVAHYGDVVRYSMSDYPEEDLIKEIERLEEEYADLPFNVYSGVDRSIFYGSFALTTDAYRADAYTEEGLLNHIFVDNLNWTLSAMASGVGSVLFCAWALSRTKAAISTNMSFSAAEEFVRSCATVKADFLKMITESYAATPASTYGLQAYGATCGEAIDGMIIEIYGNPNLLGYSLQNKLIMIQTGGKSTLSSTQLSNVNQFRIDFQNAGDSGLEVFEEASEVANDISASGGVSKLSLFGTGVLYIASAAMMLYTAYTLGHTVWNYYHPEYSDIPVALVDLIETPDGDRYIKYDVVYSAVSNSDGVYEAADLNAFAGQRWNAVYFTKSYEAGKPLIADAFAVSYTNNKPKDGYSPIHAFGELVSFDLNKYTYGIGNDRIYLSVKQSKKDKSAVADVPELVGSVIGTGYILLAGGAGLALGVGGTVLTDYILKKKKSQKQLAEPCGIETK